MFKYSVVEHQQEKFFLIDGGIWLPEIYQGSQLVLDSGRYQKCSDGNQDFLDHRSLLKCAC